MKYIILTMIVLGVVGLYYFPFKEEYKAAVTEVITQEVTVEVDALEQSIKSAQDAKKADIEAVADKAWQEAYDQEMKMVELEVIQSFNEQLDARQIELEKETKVY